MTRAHAELKSFLGKRNFKGLYSQNPLARTPDYHRFDNKKIYLTSYPIRAQFRSVEFPTGPQARRARSGQPVVQWKEVFNEKNSVTSRRPFPNNQFVRPNMMIGTSLRDSIVKLHADGESVQQISFKYGISVPRINAVIKLEDTRLEMEKKLETTQKNISKDLHKMANVMRQFFDQVPVNRNGEPLTKVDNLSEIPLQKETRQQLFLSIAESEPFGPVDAARKLHLEPAKDILSKLSSVSEPSEAEAAKTASKTPNSFFADRLEGERFLYRFTDAKVGKVGFHYGAARDDTKPGRRSVYQPNGARVYPPPEHS